MQRPNPLDAPGLPCTQPRLASARSRNSITHNSKLNGPATRKILLTLLLLLVLGPPRAAVAEPSAAALQAYAAYTIALEHRLALQHTSPSHFLAGFDLTPNLPTARLHRGELVLEEVHEPDTPTAYPGAMLHHWRGTAFAPGASVSSFEALLRDLRSYPQHFAPQVLRAATLTSTGDHLQTSMRLRQHHGLTVVLDTIYDTDFGRRDPHHGFCASRSVRIAEISNPNTAAERPLSPAEDHGFLYRLNTYWSYEQVPDGLLLQIETVSLSRDVPTGLNWVLSPYLNTIPRDSLTFTLESARNALTTNH